MDSKDSTVDRDLLVASYSFANHIEDNIKKLNNILEVASRTCQAKSAFITLLGNKKQDILAQKGIQLETMDVKDSICQYTIKGKDLLEIPDISKDIEASKLGLHDSKHNMQFYAGHPLYNDNNQCIGALCVSHDHPKTLNKDQKSTLSILAHDTIKHLDNQRILFDMVINLNENFSCEGIPPASSLELELSNLQRKTIEQQKIIVSQKKALMETNENLKAFAYIAAHDIKSPARVIYSFAQLIKEKVKDIPASSPILNYSQIIQKASNNLLNLVSSILVYAQAGSSDLELSTVNLKEVLDTVKFNLSEKIDSSNAQLNYADDLIDVQGHKEQLTQLFQNLIENGLKYQEGTREPIINIEHRTCGEKIIISISDNGIGIQEKNLYQIFTPFQRLHSSSKYEGSGLGLSTCLKVIENHESHICLESEYSKGTTITFSLKATQP